MYRISAYIISFIIVIITSLLGQYFTSKNVKSQWYDCIKPRITPPGYIFPIVWTVLYICIAIALARTLIYSQGHKRNILVALFLINLVTNVSWCYYYFYAQSPGIAMPQLLLILLSACGIVYISQDKITKYLLIPYIIWLSFASILNIMSLGKQC